VLNVVRGLDDKHRYRIKYPNDVQALVDGAWKKLSGVLVEHEFTGSVCTTTIVGVGVNILQMAFPDTITQPCTSLQLLGLDVTVEGVRTALIASIHETQNNPTESIVAQWLRELDLVGRTVRVLGNEGEWTVVGFDSNGRVRVQHNDLQTIRLIEDGDSLRYND
jgi:biotin-(acetyl-CoA carboxylase) ligase